MSVIEIKINKTESTTGATNNVVEKPSVASVKNKENSPTQKTVNYALLQTGKQIANIATSQFGEMTGNTIASRRLSTATSVAGDVFTVARLGVAGAIMVGANMAINSFTQSVNIRDANTQANLLYERSGNASINGGRGTND